MAVIERSSVISAPADKVFEILDDPERIPEYAPGVRRIEDIKRSEKRVGDSYQTVYSVMGIKFPSKFTTRESVRPQRIVAEIEGAQTGTFDWKLDSQGGKTEVTVRIDYVVKGGVVGKAMDALLLERMNEKNAEQMLENLKKLSEAEAGSQPR